MSIEVCEKCSRRIDTDYDDNCYVEVGNMRAQTVETVLCSHCRDKHYDELERQSSQDRG